LKSEISKIDLWNAKTPKFREFRIGHYHHIGYFSAPLKKKKKLFERGENEKDERPKRRITFETPCIIENTLYNRI